MKISRLVTIRRIGFRHLTCGRLLAMLFFLAAAAAPLALGQTTNPLRTSVATAPPRMEASALSTETAARLQPVPRAAEAAKAVQTAGGDLRVETNRRVAGEPASLDEPLRFPTGFARFLGTQENQNSNSTARSQVRPVDYSHSVLRQDAEPQPAPALPTPEPEIVEGSIQYETDTMFAESDCCGGDGCLQCWFPCPSLRFNNTEFSAGVSGFKGPGNRGQSGSFGFHEGVNWAAPLPCSQYGLGIQLGLNAVQSSLSGAEFTDQTRKQVFLTGGIFRRVDWGLQAGVVIDYRFDEWYTETDLTQIRGEVSWVYPCSHELGFWFASSSKTTTQPSRLLSNGTTPFTLTENWRVTDLYAFFYRRQIDDCGTVGRFFAGFTGDQDGLIGGDLSLPLSERLALTTEFTYLIPEENRGVDRGHEHEGWNIGVSLVWYPGCRTASSKDYYRPLFRVANNGSFMTERF